MPDGLDALDRRIADLAASDGAYRVACADTGESPVPLKGRSFATPEDAERAVDFARAYRETVREVDPYLDERRLVAVGRAADPLALDDQSDRGSPAIDDSSSEPSEAVTFAGDGEAEWLRIEASTVVRVRRDGDPLDDGAVADQLDAL